MQKRDYALGARIKVAMKAAGYSTAKAFCKKHRIPYLTVAQHIQGRRCPTDQLLKNYSKAFGVTAQWLKTGEGKPLENLKKSKEIVSLSAEEFEQRSKLYSDVVQSAIEVDLLSEITRQILRDVCDIPTPKSKQLGKAIASIYTDIAETRETSDIQLKMVKPAVNAFRHLF